MRCLIRLYNDFGLFHNAVRDGACPSGIVVDGHIWKRYRRSLTDVRGAVKEGEEVLLDPVTHKIERPFFRSKSYSYQQLPYYLPQLGTSPPTPAQLAADSAQIVRGVLNIQKDFGATCLLTPPLYTQTSDFPTGSEETHFSVTRLLADKFLSAAPNRVTALSLCVHVECLRSGLARHEIEAFVRDHQPNTIYLMLVEFDLGSNSDLDSAVFEFLTFLRQTGVSRIIWSYAPNWIYFLGPHGVTDFVSGINLQASLDVAALERETSDITVPHNYYIPWRFCRMVPEQAAEAVNKDILKACKCPVCRNGIPTTQNPIREHYLHVRTAECKDLRSAQNQVNFLKERLTEAEEFIAHAKAKGLKVLKDPNPTLWRKALPG